MITYKVGEFSRGIHVGVTADRLKVEHVLAFADKLREAGVPLSEQITDDHSQETRHLTGLRVSYSEKHPSEGEPGD